MFPQSPAHGQMISAIISFLLNDFKRKFPFPLGIHEAFKEQQPMKVNQ